MVQAARLVQGEYRATRWRSSGDESRCSQVIEPVVHGPGGQADAKGILGRQMAQLRGESLCSQVIEPVVHGPGGQADAGGILGH